MLYAFAGDRTGCGFHRVVWPLTELRRIGVPVTVVMPGDEVPLQADVERVVDRLTGSVFPRVRAIEVPDDCTAVLLQRPTSVLLSQCVPYLKTRNIKVLVEIDDDLHALSPKHSAYKHYNPPASVAPSFMPDTLDALMRTCEQADLVITSTPALAERYAPAGKGVVLRNRLRSDWRSCLEGGARGEGTAPPQVPPRVSPYRPAEDLTGPQAVEDVARIAEMVQAGIDELAQNDRSHVGAIDSAELTLAWAGVITTHPDDLAVLARVLPRLDTQFKIVGPAPREDEGGPLRARRLLGVEPTFTGSVTFADWLPRLAQELANSIAVAPLENSAFNRAKSWLKPLEYAAVGVPFVAADTPEYRKLARVYGNLVEYVIAADSYKDWTRKLRSLMASPALREDLIERGQKLAYYCTYANFAEDWHRAIAPLVGKP